jgi:hypothetical protein
VNAEEIIGYFTYRSFFNRTAPADDWDDSRGKSVGTIASPVHERSLKEEGRGV